MNGADPFDGAEWEAYAKHILDDVLPMLEQSSMTVSLVPTGKADVKFAVELGLSLMLGKPIILVVQPGTRVPAKLVRIADSVIDGNTDDPTLARRIAIAAERINSRTSRRGRDEP